MELQNLPKRNNKGLGVKRIGRGYGSGKGGHTVGKGAKGQKARTGARSLIGFESGNVPLFRRLPKFRGFKNPNRIVYSAVNLSDLERAFKDGETVSIKTLREKGLVKKSTKFVKILGKGKLSKKLKFVGVKMSVAVSKDLKPAKKETAKATKAKAKKA